jgi:Holliday junction resolvase RusA-like endonuclease
MKNFIHLNKDGNMMYSYNADIVLTIPGMPVSKKNSMMVAGKRLIKLKKVKDYEALIETIAAVEMARMRKQPLEGPCSIQITCFWPTCHRRDVHNVFGSICDALQGHCYLDDNQLVTVSADKFLCAHEEPRTVVQIWALEPDEAYPLTSCQLKTKTKKKTLFVGLDGKTD